MGVRLHRRPDAHRGVAALDGRARCRGAGTSKRPVHQAIEGEWERAAAGWERSERGLRSRLPPDAPPGAATPADALSQGHDLAEVIRVVDRHAVQLVGERHARLHLAGPAARAHAPSTRGARQPSGTASPDRATAARAAAARSGNGRRSGRPTRRSSAGRPRRATAPRRSNATRRAKSDLLERQPGEQAVSRGKLAGQKQVFQGQHAHAPVLAAHVTALRQ